MPIAGAFLAVGAGLSLAGSIYGASKANKDLKNQQLALFDQARLVEEQGEFEAIQTGKQFENLLGEQKLSIATSGAEFEGSVMNILDKTIKDKENNVEMIKKNAKIEANYLRTQAEQIRKKRKGLMANAVASSLGGIAQSASSLFKM
jgi:hypothetical protein